MNTKELAIVIGQLVAVGLVSACATAPPPRELLDARAAYARAESGPAARLSPATLHDAKTTLARAERAYTDESSSPAARDLAYVAERKVEIAEAEAETSQARQNAERASAHAEAARRGKLRQTEQQLSEAGAELQTERQERAAAEKRVHDTLDKLTAAEADLAVKNDTRGTVITIPDSVLFPSGKADLLPTAQNRLEKVANALKDQPNAEIKVEGHTDSEGSEMKNMDLSEERAEQVRAYLVSRGVPQDHVKAQGFGASHPVADNATPDGRATNRRVEIVVQPKEPR